MLKEEIKAWLGFNLQDFILNISAIPFFLGLFSRDLLTTRFLFAIAFLLSIVGIVIYFRKPNKKISKVSAELNKWGSVAIILMLWALMIAKLLNPAFPFSLNSKSSLQTEDHKTADNTPETTDIDTQETPVPNPDNIPTDNSAKEQSNIGTETPEENSEDSPEEETTENLDPYSYLLEVANWWNYPEEIVEITEDPDLLENIDIVVNKKYKLPEKYQPEDLVDLETTGLRYSEGRFGRKIILQPLTKLVEKAKNDGIDLAIKSAYRSYETQISTYNYWVSMENGDRNTADKYSARPGHSEHQLGTVIDFTTNECGDQIGSVFDDTKTSKWLAENAEDFGFYLSYPKGKETETGYQYESWHYRYLGKTIEN